MIIIIKSQDFVWVDLIDHLPPELSARWQCLIDCLATAKSGEFEIYNNNNNKSCYLNTL